MPFIESREEFIHRHTQATKHLGPPVLVGAEWLFANGASLDKSPESLDLRDPHPNPHRRLKVVERYWEALAEQYADEFSRIKENLLTATKMAAFHGFAPPWQVEHGKKRMKLLAKAVRYCRQQAEKAHAEIDRLEHPNIVHHEEHMARARERAEQTLQSIRSMRL
jgi:hypothetical protein